MRKSLWKTMEWIVKIFINLKRILLKTLTYQKKYGNNPDIYYDNKTLEIFLRSTTNKILELFKTGLSLIGFIV